MDDQAMILLIGELLKPVHTALQKIEEDITGVGGTVSKLPCIVHTEQINVLEDWKKVCNNTKDIKKIEDYKGRISLKNAAIMAICSSAFTLVVSLLVNYLIVGKP